ncbi:MAG: hypothetical protein U0228_35345 [Myxococcaceae bacterium]
MLPVLLMSLALGQSAEVRSPVAIIITSKRPGAEQVSPKIAQRVFESFKREGVVGLLDDSNATKELKSAGFSDPRTCQGTKACLSKLAILLGAHAVVVGVDVGKVGKTLAIHLEAVASDKDDSLAALDVSSSINGWSDAMSAPIVVFVRDVKAGLEMKAKVVEPPPPPPPVEVVKNDTPKKTDLTPPPKETDVELVKTGPEKSPKVGAWVCAGGAVASAGVAVTFAVLAGGAKSQFDASLIDLPDGTRGSRLPEDQARALAATANTDTGVAVATGAVAAGLAVVSAILFLKD